MYYGSYPFCAYFERYMLSPKIRAKRVEVIKDKICILKIQDYKIQEIHFTQEEVYKNNHPFLE